VDDKSERDGLGVFDDVQPVATKPVTIGAVASLVTLVALGVLFAVTVVVVLMYVVAPWIGKLISEMGPSR
jgi:hypothetical protein